MLIAWISCKEFATKESWWLWLQQSPNFAFIPTPAYSWQLLPAQGHTTLHTFGWEQWKFEATTILAVCCTRVAAAACARARACAHKMAFCVWELQKFLPQFLTFLNAFSIKVDRQDLFFVLDLPQTDQTKGLRNTPTTYKVGFLRPRCIKKTLYYIIITALETLSESYVDVTSFVVKPFFP